MKKISILLVIFIGLFSVMMASCGKKSDNVLRVSEVTHSVFYAPLYVAINKGYFKDEGLEIELTNAGGSDAVLTSLTSNSADIGLMGPESTIFVRNNGMKDAPKIFAQLTKCDGSFLVGRPGVDNADTFSWENLAGAHIIAGRRGGMPAMTLQYILEKNYNLKTGAELGDGVDVKFDTSIAFDMVIPTFIAGTGNYCTMFEPSASQCVQDNTGVIVAALGDEVKDVPYTCFVANQKFINNNSDKIEKFMRALKKGYDYIVDSARTDEEIVAALKPSFNTTSDSLILSSVKNYIKIGAYADSFVLKQSSWDVLQEIMDNAGELKARVNYNDVVITSFANAVE